MVCTVRLTDPAQHMADDEMTFVIEGFKVVAREGRLSTPSQLRPNLLIAAA